MGHSIATAERSKLVKPLDRGELHMAHANLPGQTLSNVVREALIKHCGSMKAASIDLRIDQGQLTRELQQGSFRFERLEYLDAGGKAAVVKALHDAFGTLDDPKSAGRRLIRELRERLDTLEQWVEHVA